MHSSILSPFYGRCRRIVSDARALLTFSLPAVAILAVAFAAPNRAEATAVTVTLSNLSQTYTGSPLSVTAATSPTATVGFSYTGIGSTSYGPSATAPTNAGTYTVAATVTTSGDTGSATGTLAINQALATVSLTGSTQTYTGSAIGLTATTSPAGVGVAYTYTGISGTTYGPSSTPPSANGTYSVTAIVSDPNYSSALTTGNVSATATLTNVSDPFGIAVDANNIYVTNNQAVSVFPLSSITTGNLNLTPSAKITGGLTGLNSPQGLTVDATHIYVTNATGTVTVYPLTATGNVAPTATITTGNDPFGIAVDANNLYVTNNQAAVSVYPLSSITTGTLNLTPSAKIVGASTGLNGPEGVAVDANHIYVANATGSTVTVYPLTATGNLAPTATLGNVNDPFGIAVNADAMYVTDNLAAIAAYALTASGTQAPLATISGGLTGLSSASGIALNASTMFVANRSTNTVTVYPLDPAPAAANLTIAPPTAETVTLSNLSQTYTGSPLSVTATTAPTAGLSVGFSYTGTGSTTYGPSATAPTNAGTYSVTATITNPAYVGSATGAFTINQATATVTLTGSTQPYTGSAIGLTATTSPAGLSVTYLYTGISGTTYGPSATPPTAAGTYAVTATLNNPNYSLGLTAGNVAPTATLTNVSDPFGIAVDANNLYVTNNQAAVSVYPLSSITTGTLNLTPSARIVGAATGLNSPQGLTVDATHIYVTNATGTVTVYPLTANGNQAPTASVTNLSDPFGIAVDANNIYVTNNQAVSVFPLSSITTGNLNLTPSAKITGGLTGLNLPEGVAVDASHIYVANATSSTVTVYPLTATGNLAPTTTLSNVNDPFGIAVNADAMYVTDNLAAIAAYALTASGTQAPLATISGGLTGLSSASGIALNASTMFVANRSTNTVTVYPLSPAIAAANLTISTPIAETVTLSNLSQTYTGSALSVTATTAPTAGLSIGFSYTGTGSTTYGPSATAPTNAGTYSVTATITNPAYVGSATGAFTINQAAATVTLNSSTQPYTGSAIGLTATTSPAGLSVTYLYTGTGSTTYGPSATPPTASGTYTVTAALNNPNYTLPLTTGNIAPTATLTNVSDPFGVAVDANNLYVTNNQAAVSVYPLSSITTGTLNLTPSARIIGAATGLNSPQGLTVDANHIYVTNATGTVTVYPLTATGNIAPTATLTSLSDPFGVAVDANNLYVTNNLTAVSVFPLSSITTGTLSLTPSAKIVGAGTGLSGSEGVAVDGSHIYVANATGSTVTVYPLTATGNQAPTATLSGVFDPFGIAVNADAIYLTTNQAVAAYALSASGSQPALATISGGLTGLNAPSGLALNSSNIFVANKSANTVTVYSLTATISPATLTISPPIAETITFSNLSQTYTGSPLSVTATTAPTAGVSVGLSYTGTGSTTYGPSATAPTSAGTYSVTATITNPAYVGSGTGAFTINPATATVTLTGSTQPYTGSAIGLTATTSPAGLSVTYLYTGISGTTYGPSATPPTAAGTYTVTATLNNPNYSMGGLTAGSVAPTATLTNVSDPFGIAVDANNLYVTNNQAAVSVYPLSSITTGTLNLTPAARIIGGATGLNSPQGLTVDANHIYVTNATGTVTVYPLTATGNQAPTASVTNLSDPFGIAVDANNIYVTNNQAVSVFPLSSITTVNLSLTPSAKITGGLTGLNLPEGVAVDASHIYVANATGSTVTVYPLTATGNLAPTATLSNVNDPFGIAVNADAMYVTDNLAAIAAYALTASGTQAPLATISGGLTGLSSASGIALNASTIFVANRSTNTVTVYPLGSTPAATLTISPPIAETVTLSNLYQTYTGSALSVTAITSPTAGLSVGFSYSGTGSTTYGPSATAPTNAGSYLVTATITNPAYVGSATGAFTIVPATATVTLSGSTQSYTGSAIGLTATTSPAGLSVTYLYTGVSGTTYGPSSTPPSAPGTYTVTAALNNPNYTLPLTTGNVAPTATLTNVSDPFGIAVDANNLYVTNNQAAVSVYPLSSITTGTLNLTPAARIIGGATGLNSPQGLTVDANHIYVTNATGTVTVYPLTATGNIAPTATLTSLTDPFGIAVDANNLYVTNNLTAVSVFPLSSITTGTLSLTPSAKIVGAGTGLSGSEGVAVDGSHIYVVNATTSTITVYPLTATGNSTPTATLTALSGDISNPFGIAVNADAIYLTANTASVAAFPLTASGAQAATTTIFGSQAGLSGAAGVALNSSEIFVANRFLNTVTIYPLAATIAPATLTITTVPVTVTLGNLSPTYTGAPAAITATTSPTAGLSVGFSYTGTGSTPYGPSPTAPTNVGTYAVTATVTSTGYTGSATGALTISPATATLTLTGSTQTYSGSALGLTATTSPAGLGVVYTYTGVSGTTYGPSATPPTAAGTYTVTATLNSANYSQALTAGNIAPTATITNISDPFGVAVDATNLYVTNNQAAVSVYPLSSITTGTLNLTPSAKIIGGSTGLSSPQGLTVNASHIYVTNATGTVTVYPLTGDGNISPTATVTTGNDPFGIAVDANNIYVTNNQAVSVFPLSSITTGTLNLTPSAKIIGASTGLNGPEGVAVDGTHIYVANSTGFSVTVYPLTATGNQTPTATLSNVTDPFGLAVNADAIYLTANQAVGAYALSASGFQPAMATISGGLTGLNAPAGLALNSSNIFVANKSANTVTVYPLVPSITATLTVAKATPAITTAPTASLLTFGQTLAASTLTGGVASTPGTFAFTAPATTPATGTAPQAVTFTPTDTIDFTTASTTANVTVAPATPAITTAPTASAITFGQALSASTLTGGGASTPGTFAFTTPATMPAAGTAPQAITFTPTDTIDYTTVSTSASVTVAQATPTITTAPTASGITFGQALSAATLSGGAASTPGTFAFTTPATTPATGTALQAVTFTPADTTDYTTANTTASVTVARATPAITTAPTASALTFGQTLSASTLTGGAASTPGTFAFTSPATTPPIGTAPQAITFTPADTADFTTASTTASVAVARATPAITTPPTASAITYGQALSASSLTGGAASTPGSFAFTNPATVPAAGTSPQAVTFTPTDTTDFTTANTTVSVTAVQVTTIASVTGPVAGAYDAGTVLRFTVTFTTPVTVDTSGGTPTLTISIGGVSHAAAYVSGSGTTALVFAYTVQAGDTALDGITVTPALTLNGGTITNSTGAAANPGFTAPNAGSVDIDTTAPVLTDLDASQVAFQGNFSSYGNGASGSTQYQTGNNLYYAGTLPGWTASGLHAIHAVDLTGQQDYAIQIWQDNVLTSPSFAGGNVAGTAYLVSCVAGPAVQADSSQVTTAADGLLFEIVRADNSVLASYTYLPGAWQGENLLLPVSFQYTGDGSGPLQIRISPSNFNSGHFGGELDDLMIAPAAAVNPTTIEVPATSAAGAAVSFFTSAYDLLNGDIAVTSSPASGSTFPLGSTSVGLSTSDTAGNSSARTFTVQVDPAVAQITLTTPTIYVYDGTPKAATATVVPAGLTPQFTYDGGSTTAPTTAGVHTVTATISSSWIAGTTSGSFTIAQATPTITTAPTASAISYGQTLAASTLSGGVAGTAGSFAFATPTAALGAGTTAQSVTFTPTDATDYTTVTVPVNVTVNPATPTISTLPTASALTYGQTLAAANLSGGTANTPGTFAFTGPTLAPSVGVQPESVTFTPTDATDYTPVTLAVNVAVNPATPTLSVTPYAVTYDGTPHAATGVATGIGGANLSADFNFSGTTHTKAGTYSDTWTFTDPTGNYASATGTVGDTIGQATATVTVTPYAVTYDGNAHTATGSVTGVGGASMSGLSLSGTTHTSAGTYSSDAWSFADPTGNYANASGTTSDSIGKATATVTVTPYAVTYDGNAHTATGSVTGVGGAALSGLSLSGTTHSAAGTYASDAWSFTDPTGNYANASGTTSDSIGKATATVAVAPYAVTYDGNAHTAAGSVTGVGGAALSGLSLSGTTHTGAGTYGSDPWTFTDPTGNYNNASGTVADAIARKAAAATLSGLAQTYGGGIEDATIATDPAGLAVLWTYNGSPLAFTPSAGNLAAYAAAVGQSFFVNVTGATGGAVTGSGFGPYALNSDLNTAAALSGLVALGQSAVAQVTLSADGTTFQFAPTLPTSGYTAGPTQVGTYTVTGTVVDFNYNGSVTGTLTISAATLAVTADAQTKVYGASDPALTYQVVSGLQGSDTAASVLSGALIRASGETVAGAPYAITQGTLAANSNYTVAFTANTLTITPATLTIAAAPATKTYGAADPALTYTVAGLVPTDSAGAVLSGTLSRVAGEQVALSPLAILQGTLAANSNYTITYIGAALTITQATATISVSGYAGTYDGAAHGATGTATGVGGADLGSLLSLGASFANVPGGTANWSFSDPAGNYVSAAGSAAITLAPAAASVTALGETKTYGTPDPVLATVLSGFVPADNITAGAARVAGENVSTYAIVPQPSGAALANYLVTLVNGTFTITPANASVTPAAATKVYGASDPALTGALSGFLAADHITASYTRAAGEAVSGGPYAINATLGPIGALTNYAITYNTANFAITPATLTVAANPQTKVYGTSDPALTYSASGFQFTDSAAVVLSGSLTRVPGENVAQGPYAILQGTLEANSNYALAYAGSTLTITRATAPVVLGALSQTYGGNIEDATAMTTPTGLTVLWSYNGQLLAFAPSGDTLAAYAAAVGQTVYVNVTGATGGNVIGSGPAFGISSDLGTAAVQAGVLTVGQSAVLQITISADGTNFQIVGIATGGFTTGPEAAGTYTVTGTVVDPNYSGTVTGTLVITQATPVITWSAPSAITHGTALSATQLNASANVSGTFAYTPAAGTVLNAGPNQALSVTFTPTDSGDYTNATAATTISVGQAAASVTLSNLSQVYDGTPKAASVSATPAVATSVTYGGSATVPTAAGTYTVVATVTDPNYSGSATGTLTIAPATPVITWTPPAAIIYGAALSGTQLNATANVPGTFVYTPASGSILNAGANQTLAVSFAPTDGADYTPASATTMITVNQQLVAMALSNLNPVYDGTPKAATAATSVPGLPVVVTYNGGATAPVTAGSYTVVATVNSADYTGAATGTLTIAKATPSLAWASPAAITYGTALSATQLNAMANVPGTFTYTPAAGTVLHAGANQALTASFTPTDAVDYTAASVSTLITVKQANPTVTWNAPAAITYGTLLSASQLSATANVPGTFTYTPAAGTVLHAGANQALTASFTPTDTVDYTAAPDSTLITVNQANSIITWNAPAAISYGTLLSATQLNATANVPGTLAYTPAAGVKLNAGANQTLAVAFTPTDAIDYTTASASTRITVNPATATVTLSNTTQVYSGTPKSVTVTSAPAGLAVTVTYNGSAIAPTAVGTYVVVATVVDPNWIGTASGTLTITSPSATIVLNGLNQTYSGQPLPVTATTNPANLTVTITYNGSSTAPTYPGTYTVVATITSANYSGSASGSMVIGIAGLVSQSVMINGGAAFEGSIQVTTPQSITLNGGATLSGDLLVAGTPNLINNGGKMVGTLTGTGASTPSNYTVILNGGAVMRYLVKHVAPVALPTVATPPSSSNNVTLNSGAAAKTLVAGSYGSITVNGGASIIMGVAGATTPSVYTVQNLTINGGGTMKVVGPVVVTVGNSVSLNGNAGASGNSEWLVLAVANGGLTLNGGVTFDGSVICPTGQVIVNGNSVLNGTISCANLTLNGGAIVDPNGP